MRICDSGNLRVVSYNSISLWVVSIGLLIRLWVESRISLHYIKSALSIRIISILHVKQSAISEVIWYIPFIYTCEQPKIHCDLNINELEKYANLDANINLLQKQLLTGNRMTVLQILENSQENNRNGVQYQYIYRPCGFIKKVPCHGYFCENFSKSSEQIFLYNTFRRLLLTS